MKSQFLLIPLLSLTLAAPAFANEAPAPAFESPDAPIAKAARKPMKKSTAVVLTATTVGLLTYGAATVQHLGTEHTPVGGNHVLAEYLPSSMKVEGTAARLHQESIGKVGTLQNANRQLTTDNKGLSFSNKTLKMQNNGLRDRLSASDRSRLNAARQRAKSPTAVKRTTQTSKQLRR